MNAPRLTWMAPTVVVVVAVLAHLVASALQRTSAEREPEDELGPIISRTVVERGVETWEAALWQAGYWKRMAYHAAHVERYQTELPDEPRPAGVSEEPRRRATLKGDRSGHLRRARAYAVLAIARAQTEEQRYVSTLELSRIEHDAEQHKTEYRLAERLTEWRPGDRRSAAALLRAARCTGKVALEAQIEAAFPALLGGPSRNDGKARGAASTPRAPE
jgi:hypothetical protein